MKTYKEIPDQITLIHNDYIIFCFLYFPIVVFSDTHYKKFKPLIRLTKFYEKFLNAAIKYHINEQK